MCLHISSRLALHWPAALAARPHICTSSRSLANSAMQGGIPPPPDGVAWGVPIADILGARTGVAAGTPLGPGVGAACCWGVLDHGSVCAATSPAGSIITAMIKES